jgi:hypothetical protein
LAFGACYWGMLLLPMLIRPDVSLLTLLIFGPGYLVTVGYLIRAVSCPPLLVRRFIWLASLLVQGTWIVCISATMAEQINLGLALNEPILPLAWWVFATVASVIGLCTEQSKAVSQGAVP